MVFKISVSRSFFGNSFLESFPSIEPNVFLRVEADSTVTPARLDVEFIQLEGREMWKVEIDETMLRPN